MSRKRSLQILLGMLSLIPLVFGLRNMIMGVGVFLPAEQITPALDSQWRFQSAYYLSLAFIVWSIIPKIASYTTIFRILIMTLFVGGLARLYSYLVVGEPPQVMFYGMILELCLPGLIFWQAKIKK